MQLFDLGVAVAGVVFLSQRQGHHFLQIPGPSPIPERVLRAMDKQVIDHRGLTLCSTSFPPLRCIIFSGQEVANKGRGLPLASRKDPGVRY
jgi:hypothetical protein